MMKHDKDECDFCSEEVQKNDRRAVIYPATDIVDAGLGIAYRGSWLACSTCAAFVRQYDNGLDNRAKENLARRSLEKFRRKYGLRGARLDDRTVNSLLMIEIRLLHDKFWEHRQGEPVPYATKALEG